MADSRKKLVIPNDVLGDLCSRFLLNIPKSEKDEMVRLCFQIELAHWFYLDFYRAEKNSSLPDCKVRDFAKAIFEAFPFLLNPPDANVEKILDDWREYKHSVPTYGAALFDSTLEYVLLVQGILANSSWGFPKGKVNKDEEPDLCAIREVMEETGFNIKPYLEEDVYIEQYIHEQLTRLYLVLNVPMDTKFNPQTRNEIGAVKWFALSDLPEHKKDQTPKQNLNMTPNNFFMVIPFVKSIKKFINSHKHATKGGNSKNYENNSRHTPKRNRNTSESVPRKYRIALDNQTAKDKERLEEQKRNFSQANQSHFESIMQLMNSPHAGSASSHSRKNKKNSTPGKSMGRGQILSFQPEAWNNFKLDYGSLITEMDKVLNV